MKEKKNFLLLAPEDYQLYALIIKNLECNNEYNVVHLSNKIPDFKYKNLWERVKNFIHKTFLRDKKYKVELRKKYSEGFVNSKLNQYESYDECLVIRADFFSFSILRKAKDLSLKFIAFQYDGLTRDPSIFSRIRMFDKFYAFDKNDVTQYYEYNIEYSSNFYFDFPEKEINSPIVQDIYYLSSFHPSRINDLVNFHKIIGSVLDRVKFELIYWPGHKKLIPKYAWDNFKIGDIQRPFEYQINKIRQSNYILDLCVKDHAGLSFRIFEGLKYAKKVITNNIEIVNQEFYHPNNYLLISTDNIDSNAILEFLERDYQRIDPKIRDKYAFNNWKNKLFTFDKNDIHSNTPLVSIILSCRNSEKIISESLSSLILQSYNKIEIIIIDNGSTDDSSIIINNFIIANKSCNIQFIQQEKASTSSAKNNAFKSAKGEFLLFLDASEFIDPTYIDKCLKVFREKLDTLIVYSDVGYINGSKKEILDLENYSRDNILFVNSISSFAMFRNFAFRAVGLFDEEIEYGAEWDLWIKMTNKYTLLEVYKIPEVLCYYHLEKDELGIKHSTKSKVTYNKIYDQIFSKHQKLYEENDLSIEALLNNTRYLRSNNFDRYKLKYYNQWHKKYFYYFFKRNKYRDIFKH